MSPREAGLAGQVFREFSQWTYRVWNNAFFTCSHKAGGSKSKRSRKRIAEVVCLTRDGWRYPGVDLELFRKLRRKKAVSSSAGGPYRITRRGLELVRSQLDNR